MAGQLRAPLTVMQMLSALSLLPWLDASVNRQHSWAMEHRGSSCFRMAFAAPLQLRQDTRYRDAGCYCQCNFPKAFMQQTRSVGVISAALDSPTANEPYLLRHPDSSKVVLRIAQCQKDLPSPNTDSDLVIDASFGWGDGHHPTTNLCLEFLASHVSQDKNQEILDFGTGSGILGMAACRMGCKHVLGVDIDDEAIEQAESNLLENSITSDRMSIHHVREIVQDMDGISLRDFPEQGARQFDVVAANILVGPLMKLAPVLALAVKEDTGVLCLSGLREEQVPALATEYAKFGVKFTEIRTRTHTNWRVGAEGEGVWAQVSATRRSLSSEERAEIASQMSELAVG